MAETPSQKFARLREAAGLTQEQAARLLHVHAQTVSRWERGQRQIKAADMDRAVALFTSASSLGRSVPRGTKPFHETPTGQVLSAVERDAIRRGATDEEVDFLLATVSSREALQLCHAGNPDAAADQMVALIRSMMTWMDNWIATRKGGAPATEPPTKGVKVAGAKPPRVSRRVAGGD